MNDRISMYFLKWLVAKLPRLWQQELKRFYYRIRIYLLKFKTTEPEFRILDSIISSGDWVLDIGANIGVYTKRFSDLVGPQGRVIAIETLNKVIDLMKFKILFKTIFFDLLLTQPILSYIYY